MKPAILILAILLAGCATNRYLTEHQDAELAKACAEGCMIVPASMFPELIEAMRGGRI